MVLIVGCSNDNNTEKKTNTNSTNENEEINKGTNKGETEIDGVKFANVLGLNDKDEIETTIAHYEMTPTNIETFNERDGHEPTNEGEVFILIDVTIKNLDDEAVVAEDIIDLGVKLDGEEFNAGNMWGAGFDSFVNELEDDYEIEPNEEVEAQLIFETDPSDYFVLYTSWGLEDEADQNVWKLEEN